MMSQGQVFERDHNHSKEKEDLRQKLKKGYCQMAELNLKLAQEGLKADKEIHSIF